MELSWPGALPDATGSSQQIFFLCALGEKHWQLPRTELSAFQVGRQASSPLFTSLSPDFLRLFSVYSGITMCRKQTEKTRA